MRLESVFCQEKLVYDSVKTGKLMKKQGKTTIYDIAKMTGASASTVSAALSGSWKQRRIKEDTALEIQRVAKENGYTPNLQARGLRKARSGLVGMIVPAHTNRYFSTLSNAFEAEARKRGLCPVIVSTLRDPKEERHTVETLISYAIDSLFVVGATDPDAISDLCAGVDIKQVNLDLPGTKAPSIITDDYFGAKLLTRELLQAMKQQHGQDCDKVYFIGGSQSDYATGQRISAFKDVMMSEFGSISDDRIFANSYDPNASTIDAETMIRQNGGLPCGLFVNSTFAFEGILRHFSQIPRDQFSNITVGCYDYDPFASFMHFPVIMVRQNVKKMMAEAFKAMESDSAEANVTMVRPTLIQPRTMPDMR